MKKKGAASSSLFILWEKASKAKKTDAKLYCNIINSSPKSQKVLPKCKFIAVVLTIIMDLWS
jgi:hypothetical protein